MNRTCETIPDRFAAFEDAGVTDVELTQIEGGFGGDSTILLILAVILIGAGTFAKNTTVSVTATPQTR